MAEKMHLSRYQRPSGKPKSWQRRCICPDTSDPVESLNHGRRGLQRNSMDQLALNVETHTLMIYVQQKGRNTSTVETQDSTLQCAFTQKKKEHMVWILKRKMKREITSNSMHCRKIAEREKFNEDKCINIELNTGSPINVLPYEQLTELGFSKGHLSRTEWVLSSYTSVKLKPMGTIQLLQNTSTV